MKQNVASWHIHKCCLLYIYTNCIMYVLCCSIQVFWWCLSQQHAKTKCQYDTEDGDGVLSGILILHEGIIPIVVSHANIFFPRIEAVVVIVFITVNVVGYISFSYLMFLFLSWLGWGDGLLYSCFNVHDAVRCSQFIIITCPQKKFKQQEYDAALLFIKKKTNSRNKCLQSNVLLTENLANTPNS